MALPVEDPQFEANLRSWRNFVAEAREMTRRSFLAVLAWGAFGLAMTLGTIATVRLLFPNVSYDESFAFKAGSPKLYPVGSTTVDYGKRVVINRDPDGIYAIVLICTHLGCTPRWFQSDSMFRCPCHGSRYLRDGIRFYGPAPRPMDRAKVLLAPDGQVLIDRSAIVDRSYRLAVG